MASKFSIFGDFIRAIVPIFIVGTVVVGYWYWGRPQTVETAEPPAAQPVPVATSVVKPFKDPISIEVDGVAQPHRHISIAAEVSGRVTFKNPEFNDGKFLKAGSLLYEIDSADYATALRRIEEELRQAETALQEWVVDRKNAVEQLELAEKDLALATKESTRLKGLRDSNAASVTEMDQGMRAELAARVNIQSLTNQIRALDARKARAESALALKQVELEQAKRNLERTKITAPVDCVIVTDDCEEGSYVQGGKVVAVVNDLHRAEVSCQLELDDLFWLWKIRSPQELEEIGSQPGIVYDIPPVPVVVEFLFHDRLCRWSGVISRLGGTGIDLTTRTIPCRVLVDNPLQSVVLNSAGDTVDDILPPPLTTGMFVNVKIAVEPKEDLLSVPPTAVRSGGVVWIMREGKLNIQPIKVARRLKEQVLINATAGGVQADDRVVVSPLAVAMDGMLIEEKRRE